MLIFGACAVNSEQKGVIFTDELFRCAARQIADAPPSVWDEVQAIAQVFDCTPAHVLWVCIAGSARGALTERGETCEGLCLVSSSGLHIPLGVPNPLSTLLHVKAPTAINSRVLVLPPEEAAGLVQGMATPLNALLVAAIWAGQMGEVDLPALVDLLDQGVPDVDTLIETLLVSVVGEERLGQAFK